VNGKAGNAQSILHPTWNSSPQVAANSSRGRRPNILSSAHLRSTIAAVMSSLSPLKDGRSSKIRELSQIAERRSWQVVEIYRDAGISGAKGRDGRPGLDTMLKDASRRKFDVVMAWAFDRLGRSLVDLLGTIQGLEACCRSVPNQTIR
jgi:DNA invertase Pin-like site-specific DNA recombinase